MPVCSAHGFVFGTLYAPVRAILFGLDFKGMIAWIVTEIPCDVKHGVSNFFCGILMVPLISAVKLAEKSTGSGQ